MNGDAQDKRAELGKRAAGFTLVETMVAVAIIGVIVIAAIPNMQSYTQNARSREAAKLVADAFNVARAQAIRTGNNQVLFFSAAPPNTPVALLPGDVANTPLPGGRGGMPPPMLLLDDGPPGSATQNCIIDPTEDVTPFNTTSNDGAPPVQWGPTAAPVAVVAPNESDGITEIPASGSTFRTPGGALTTWVQFRPDGVPVAIDSACNAGRLGTGGGTIYVSGPNRDYAITLSPLGVTRVHTFNPATQGWTI